MSSIRNLFSSISKCVMMMKSKKVGKNKLIHFMYSMTEDVRSSVQVQSDDNFRKKQSVFMIDDLCYSISAILSNLDNVEMA